MNLTATNYEKILKHYKKKIPKTLKEKRDKTETLLSKKMCSCVKKVKGYESNSKKRNPLQERSKIAICNKSIFRNRGIKYNRITCKKKPKFIGNKKTGIKLNKSRKNIF